MMEWLESLDRSFVLWVNSWNTPFFDEFMWIVSGKLTWIPLYLLLIALYVRSFDWRRGLLFLFSAILCVVLSDQISVHLFKDTFLRYRPSHHALLTNQLHFYDLGNNDLYKGGLYGFVSSHAANFTTVCFFAYLQLRNRYKWLKYILFFSVLIVCLSRIYLGVHYLSDVCFGALLGIIIAWLIDRFVFQILLYKLFQKT